MASGGARVRSGPAPDPNAIRRGRKADQETWLTLPAGGFTGVVPDWPWSKATAREKKLWAELWAKPQAFAWAKSAIDPTEVVEYIKLMLEFESGDTKVAGELRQRRDSLGLSVSGMARNRWRIGEIEQAPAADGRKSASAMKNRLKVVK